VLPLNLLLLLLLLPLAQPGDWVCCRCLDEQVAAAVHRAGNLTPQVNDRR
jgi:hypothetical protein